MKHPYLFYILCCTTLLFGACNQPTENNPSDQKVTNTKTTNPTAHHHDDGHGHDHNHDHNHDHDAPQSEKKLKSVTPKTAKPSTKVSGNIELSPNEVNKTKITKGKGGTKPSSDVIRDQDLKVFFNQEDAINIKVPSSAKHLLSSTFAGKQFCIGNINQGKLNMMGRDHLMTPISMQQAQRPGPISHEASYNGKGAIVVTSQLSSALYEAEIVCVFDRPVSQSMIESLKVGKQFIDDLCKQ